MNDILLQVKDLVTCFPLEKTGLIRRKKYLCAVNGVSFDLREGETLGLVGESGCGKTTTGRSILRLVEPTAGTVTFGGADVSRLDSRGIKAFRRSAQMIFQDPFASLNPRMTVGDIVAEPLLVHNLYHNQVERKAAVESVLRGDIPNPADPPSGCAFCTRCPIAEAVCSQKIPEMMEVEPDHFAACHAL